MLIFTYATEKQFKTAHKKAKEFMETTCDGWYHPDSEVAKAITEYSYQS